MGEVSPQGSIRFKGSDIAGLPSYRIAHLGLGYVPEHRDAGRTEGERGRPQGVAGGVRG
jgi:ABC-type branched-subunit amino acid transport system ATPase component